MRGSGSGTIFKRCDCATSQATTDQAKLRAWRKCPHAWYLRHSQGTRKVYESFKSETAAKLRSDEIYRMKVTGDDRAQLDRKRAQMPFVVWAQQWIGTPGRIPRTRVTYNAALRIIESAIGTKSVRQVADDRRGAMRLIEGRSDTYGPKIRNVMTGALNAARDDGMIGPHSLDRIKIQVSTRAKKWQKTTHAQRAALAEGMGEYGLAVWTAYYLGLRAGESLGLRKSDFVTTIGQDGSFTKLVLTRQRQMHAKGADPDDYLKGRGETHDLESERSVFVPPELAQMIRDAKTYDDAGSLFPAGFNSTLYARVRKARESAGLPSSFTLHSLRHEYVSERIAEGLTYDEVGMVIGHSSPVITARVYGHQTDDGLERFGRARKTA